MTKLPQEILDKICINLDFEIVIKLGFNYIIEKKYNMKLWNDSSFEVFKWLYQNKPEHFKLHDIYSTNNLDIVKYLEGKEEIDYKLLLTSSATKNNIEIMKYIIEERGIDIQFRDNFVIKIAHEYGNLNIIDYCRSKGVDIELECKCENNLCPNTCEHKQFKRNYTDCYLYDTCECGCNCPNDSFSGCDFCQEGGICDECTLKICTPREYSICRFKCLQEITSSILDDYLNVCIICWKDDVTCYSMLNDRTICQECYGSIMCELISK